MYAYGMILKGQPTNNIISATDSEEAKDKFCGQFLGVEPEDIRVTGEQAFDVWAIQKPGEFSDRNYLRYVWKP